MTTNERQEQATDLDIAAWHVWIDDEPDAAIGSHVSAGEIRKLLNRLAASEARVKELEAENEWRGLLWLALENGMVTRWIDMDGGYLALQQVNDDGFPCGLCVRLTNDDIPARPDDATVAKIKEAIGG